MGVLSCFGDGRGVRPLGDTGVFVLDADTEECLHYEAVAGVPLKKNVRIPREVLSKHANVDVRNDLIDCGIDICSVEVRRRFFSCFVVLCLWMVFRCHPCSRITLTTSISDGTLCMEF